MKPDQKLSKLFEDYHPRPGERFYQRMANTPWNQKEKPMTAHSQRKLRFGWQAAAVLVLVLTMLAFSIPSVRASISAWLGLSVAPSNQMPAQAVTLAVLNTPTPTQENPTPAETVAPPAETPPANTAQPGETNPLSAQAGWEVLTAAYLPEGYAYQSAYFDTNHQMAILTYTATRPLPGSTDPSLTETKTITLLQAAKNDFVPMQIAPSTQVEDVTVGNQPGAYAVGAWDTEFVPDDKAPGGGNMVSTWRSDLKIQNLYWQVGDIYLVLISDDEAVSRQEMIKTAEGVGR